jgi:hypothetical protein
LYKFVFLTIPVSGPLNFSVIEAVLFGLLRLARSFPAAAAKAIGQILVFTGQPGEAAGVAENAAVNAGFRSRIEYILAVVEPFIQQADALLKAARAGADEEALRQRRDGMKMVRTGINTRVLCKLWLTQSPLSQNPPRWPSWCWRPGPRDPKGGDRPSGRGRNDRPVGNRRLRKADRK